MKNVYILHKMKDGTDQVLKAAKQDNEALSKTYDRAVEYVNLTRQHNERVGILSTSVVVAA